MEKERLKELAAEKAVEEVQSGMILGLGTGSTIYYALLKLGQMVKLGLDIIGIPTSEQTSQIAEEQGIRLSTVIENPVIDLTIDGADEVDPSLNLIKGLGGALVREKIIAHASNRLVIVADESKIVDYLGAKVPLPVEVVQFGWESTQMALNQICQRSVLRQVNDQTFLSDNGNFILDCYFDQISDPKQIEIRINGIPGVVDNGLFVGRADRVIFGTADGIQTQDR